ncbi:hypothetical protein KBD33_00305 [Candidatus Gracilibacteria bacterium]|nr:hypothetical protein [Candidatus Gracilibacteria bacterium]
MKKYLVIFLCGICSLFSSNIFADSMSGAGTLNTITEVINSMTQNGVIEEDLAKYKINYYSDQIFVHGTNLNAVLTGSEEWARSELWNVMSKKLYWLKEQGYLTSEKYDTYILNYSGAISTGSTLQLGTIYKDFKVFEKDLISVGIPRSQDALYNSYKDRLAGLLKERRITQEKYYTWLEKIKIQIYQYKSDVELMALDFDEEAARYTAIIPCAPCSPNCTSETVAPSCSNPNTSTTDYTKQVKLQYGKLYTKMTLKNLQLTLTRTKKLEKKYKDSSKTKLKIQAQIKLLEEEIVKKVKASVK